MAFPVPTIAGTPSSRLTMAACEVRPPWSVTIAAARFMIGTQSGSVVVVTRIAPSTKRPISAGLSIRQTRPATIESPMPRPETRAAPFFRIS